MILDVLLILLYSKGKKNRKTWKKLRYNCSKTLSKGSINEIIGNIMFIFQNDILAGEPSF